MKGYGTVQIIIDSPLGTLGRLLDPNGPTIRIAKLSKAELATLTKAAGILEALREAWGGNDSGDESHPMDIDAAMAMYTMQQIVEENGEFDL